MARSRHLRVSIAQPDQNRLDARGQTVVVVPELAGEAVAGIEAGSAARTPCSAAWSAYEGPRCGSTSGWQLSDFHESHADHGSDRITGATRPAGDFQVVDEVPDLEQGGNRLGVATTRVRWFCPLEAENSCGSMPPGVCATAGAYSRVRYGFPGDAET